MKTISMEKQLNDFTTSIFGRKRDGKQCVTCGSKYIKPEDFRDTLSLKEYNISFMCQKCQDSVFGE